MRARLKAKRNYRDIRRLKSRKGPARVRVGILSGAGAHPMSDAVDPATLAEIAFWNETGTIHIPPRPFLAVTMYQHNYYKAELLSALLHYLTAQNYKTSALHKIGLRAAADVKITMTKLMTPPNAISVQKQKAAKVPKKKKVALLNNPLIDTEITRATIAHEVLFK